MGDKEKLKHTCNNVCSDINCPACMAVGCDSFLINNFNKEAMEEKIKLNKDRGFSIGTIKIMLMEEQLDLSKQINTSSARCVELQDQIEYIQENCEGKNVKA